MNLNQLKLFYLAVKKGSLSAAADDLNITQPAVTKGIQKLQEYYEVDLAHRIGKKLVLTPAGESLFEISEKIFDMEKLAEDCLNEHHQQKMGQLRIHTSESFGAYYLPEIISLFSKFNANIQITADILPNHLVVENTVSLQNDLGIVSHPVTHRKLLISEIMEEEMVIIVSPEHAFAGYPCIHPRQLHGQSMIMHEEGSIQREAILKFISEFDISIAMPMVLSNNEAIKRAVERQTGMALISRRVACEEVEAGKLAAIPLSGGAVTRKFYLVRHREKHMSKSMEKLMDLVAEWSSEYREKSFDS
jgi:LysR family transcriptional regulator, transcriptional activator of the cysJI operon